MQSSQPYIREPAVAGQFYPSQPEELEREVAEKLGSGPKRDALGVMAPHAGYVYSGAVAGAVYGAVNIPNRLVILGPNHTGMGAAAALMDTGIWRLPGGDVPVDAELARSILDASHLLSSDKFAHIYEHSIEVQLPFLRHLAGDMSFVPISIMSGNREVCRDIGQAVAKAISGSQEPVLIVASSDMTHYESGAEAKRKDELALGRMLSLDAEGLLDTVYGNDISMCGVMPAAAMLFSCNELGATDAELISYANSGDVTGDYGQVVGYAGVAVF